MPPTQLLPISTIHEDPTTDKIAPAARQTAFLEEYMHLSLLVLQTVEEYCCLPSSREMLSPLEQLTANTVKH